MCTKPGTNAATNHGRNTGCTATNHDDTSCGYNGASSVNNSTAGSIGFVIYANGVLDGSGNNWDQWRIDQGKKIQNIREGL